MNSELADIAFVAGVVVTVGAAIEVLRRFVRGLWRAYRVTHNGLIHLSEVREVVIRELMPNGGGSLVDRVHRIDARLALLEQERQQ